MDLIKPFRSAVAAVMPAATAEKTLKQLETERGARNVQARCLTVLSASKQGSPAAMLATRQLAVAKNLVRRAEVQTMLDEQGARRRQARETTAAELERCRLRVASADEALQPLRADHARLAGRLATAKADLDRRKAELDRERAGRIETARNALDKAVREADEEAERLAADQLQAAQRHASADHDFGALGLRVESLQRQVEQMQGDITRLETERRQLEGAALAHEVRLDEIDHDDLVANLVVASAKAMAAHARLRRLTGAGGSGPRALPLKFFDATHVPYGNRAVYPGDLPESVIEQLRVELFADVDLSAFDTDPKDLEGYGQAQPAAA